MILLFSLVFQQTALTATYPGEEIWNGLHGDTISAFMDGKDRVVVLVGCWAAAISDSQPL